LSQTKGGSRILECGGGAIISNGDTYTWRSSNIIMAVDPDIGLTSD